MSSLTILPVLQGLIPPLHPEERAQLAENIRAEGCRDALIVWKEEQTLLDGHHRYAICMQANIPYTIQEISLPDLAAAQAWMLQNQLGRRNLTPEQMSYLRGKQRELLGHKKGRPEKQIGQTGLLKTDEQLADEHKVAVQTIKRDAAYAKAVDAVAEVIPAAKVAMLTRDSKLTRQDVNNLAKVARESPQAAQHVFAAVQEAVTPAVVKQLIQTAVHETKMLHAVIAEPAAFSPIPLTLLAEEVTPQRGIEEVLSDDDKPMFVVHNPDSHPVFNRTNEMVDWASWTWNPVTGCWHGCAYCYARGIANNTRMADAYPKQFEPTFHPARLAAPANTPYPHEITRPADRNVFTCSMADLFGKWVPEAWILAVFERVRLHPEWNFLFLTKFPQRLAAIGDTLGGFPVNAWLGCTVDAQARVATAERAFACIRATVRWLSIEPMNERLTFTSLTMFDWLVMGGQSASVFNGTPARQPEWEWVEHLWAQARAAGLGLYWKENLEVRPKEMPRFTHTP